METEMLAAYKRIEDATTRVLFIVPEKLYDATLKALGCYAPPGQMSGRSIRLPKGGMVSVLPATFRDTISSVVGNEPYKVILAGWGQASAEDIKNLPVWVGKASDVVTTNSRSSLVEL